MLVNKHLNNDVVNVHIWKVIAINLTIYAEGVYVIKK